MKKTIINIFKYVFSLVLAVFLFWFVYKDQDFQSLENVIYDLDYRWIALSIALSLISHLSRGWRWSIALRPLGYKVGVHKTFMAVMVGYFANLLVTRSGEVARCAILKRTDQVPINASLGAVITERAFDFLMLIMVVTFGTIVEYKMIGAYITERFDAKADALINLVYILIVLGIIGIGALILIIRNRATLRKYVLFEKIEGFVLGIWGGVSSISKLTSTEKAAYIGHTLVIWVLYYLMSYVIFFSWEATASLSPMTALSVMIMSGLAIILPTPGGAGSYHLFVSVTLGLYGLTEEMSTNFAFVMYTSQFVTMFVVGLVSLVLLEFVFKRKSQKIIDSDESIS